MGGRERIEPQRSRRTNFLQRGRVMHRDRRVLLSFIPPRHRFLTLLGAAAIWGVAVSGTSPSGESIHARNPHAAGLNFAPVVERVMPSVVTIFTSHAGKAGEMDSAVLDDPLMRKFFGQQ